jgi:surfactin synthase thioesterase subunit
MTTVPARDETWIRRFHDGPAGGGPRLVCFPYAGGSASYFLRLSQQLSPTAEVLALQYPGRQDRRMEPALDSLPDLADQVHEVLRSLGDGPTAFFGHSMGAVVAFEVARRMEAEGRSPLRLFASARRPPSVLTPESVHTLDDAGLVGELRKLSGTDQTFLEDPDLLAMILPVLRADYTAIETYQAEPGASVSCPISALAGDQDPRVDVEQMHGWAKHTSGSFDLTVFPGGHFYLGEQTAPVAAVVRDRLARAAG